MERIKHCIIKKNTLQVIITFDCNLIAKMHAHKRNVFDEVACRHHISTSIKPNYGVTLVRLLTTLEKLQLVMFFFCFLAFIMNGQYEIPDLINYREFRNDKNQGFRNKKSEVS
jgi:uncharacterized membrane protein YjdF